MKLTQTIQQADRIAPPQPDKCCQHQEAWKIP